MKYKKNSETVDATQFTGEDHPDVEAHKGCGVRQCPVCQGDDSGTTTRYLKAETPAHTLQYVRKGDWIITKQSGSKSVLSDVAFQKYYRKAMSDLIYIASPYSNKDPEKVKQNFETVAKYCAEQVAAGEVCISPIAYGHILLDYKDMPGDYNFWENFCLTMLSNCSILRVLKIKGWHHSKGVKAEIKYAEENNIPIEYIKI